MADAEIKALGFLLLTFTLPKINSVVLTRYQQSVVFFFSSIFHPRYLPPQDEEYISFHYFLFSISFEIQILAKLFNLVLPDTLKIPPA